MFAKSGQIVSIFAEGTPDSVVHQLRNALISLGSLDPEGLVKALIEVDRGALGNGHDRKVTL